MKRIYFALIIVLISVLFFNCQKEFSAANFGSDNAENNVSAPITATLQGNIYDENEQPAIGVEIKVGTKTSITNDHGYFRIRDAALDKNASLVIAEKPGYFTGYRSFNATSGVNQIVIKLLKKTLAGSVDGANGGDIAFSNGSKVSLPANGFIKKSDGSSYNGTVNVYAHYIDPAASDINESVPGSFMANDKNNKRVVLKSFGMMAVELESASGEKLQIAKNNTAKLTIAIPSSLQSSAPSSISLWYVDEQTGLWKEEGSATKSGTTYVGAVKHFSFWNCDFSNPAFKVSMTITNAKHLPLIYTEVVIKSSANGIGHGYTDSLGQLSGLVPANEELMLEMLDGCGVVYSQKIGPFLQNTDLGNIAIENTISSIVTIEGKIMSCNNAPVSKGYAIINCNNIMRYADVNNNGDFSTTFVACLASSTTCEIVGVDETIQEQGTFATVPITSPVTFAGNISGCGNSTLEFINYKIDGSNYNLSTGAGDSLSAYTNQAYGSSLFITSISGNSQRNSINFSFNNNQTQGIFSLNYFSSDTFIGTTLIRPFTASITNYPVNIGEFYEGNFTGNFTDTFTTAPLHKITCSFRLRKNN